jgi:hypothetical protein
MGKLGNAQVDSLNVIYSLNDYKWTDKEGSKP